MEPGGNNNYNKKGLGAIPFIGMPLSITLPAITRPRRRAEILTRHRLLDLLFDLLERKLILVIAPAGYGKTSLLIDFAHQKNFSACWYSIDQHDHDLRRFLAHFIASIARTYPAFGHNSNAALQRLNKPGEDIEALITVIVNELFEQIEEHFVIVLDDFHHIGDSPEIASFISRFVGRVGENCHLVIASRQEPDLPDLELLVSHGLVGRVSLCDLAFTSAELQALANQNHVKVSNAQVDAIIERTEGWITGILLTPHPANSTSSTIFPGIHANETGLPAYWHLLVERQPKYVQDFLLYSSILDEFNADLCAAALPPSLLPADANWNMLVEKVLQDNLFALPVGEDGEWLRYHSLFKDYLQDRLEREHPGSEQEILRQVIQVYRTRNNWERAYHTARRLEDQDILLDVIEQAGPTLLRYERINTITEWLENIPPKTLAAHPGLISLQGVTALMGGQTRRGIDLLSQAEAALRGTGDRKRLGRTLARRLMGHYFVSDYRKGLDDAEEALAIVGNESDLQSTRALALRACGVCLHSLDRTTEGLQDIEQALEIFQALEDVPNAATTYQELGIIHRSTGNLEAAHAAYLKAEDFWRAENNPYRLADLFNNMGVFYHHPGDYEQAAATLIEGLKYARLAGFARMEAFILASLGDLYTDLLAGEDAEKMFEKAWEIAQRIENRFLCFYIPCALACLAQGRNDLARARYLHDQAIRFVEPHSPYEPGLLAMQAGRLALVENRMNDALGCFAQALEHFQAGKLKIEEVKAHCYCALVSYTAGDVNSSLAHLKQAFLLAPPAKLYIVLLDAGRSVKPVLEYAVHDLELGSKSANILERLRKFEASLPEIRRKLRKNITKSLVAKPKLRIRALGGVLISLNGQKFDSNAWQSRVQRDLLFYFLHNQHSVTKETLLATFWGNIEHHGTQFNNVLYKIRRLLVDDITLSEDGRYQFNRALDYEYDVEDFLALAASMAKEPGAAQRMQICQQMRHLYRGKYLPEVDGVWAAAEREHLHNLHMKATLELAEYHFCAGDYLTSSSYCWGAIEQEPCNEEAYRMAMRIAAGLGDRARVTTCFDLCQQALEQNFQVAPSTETSQTLPSIDALI
jgi:two-component SAPR family response regulator